MKLSLVAVDLDGTLLGGTSGRYGFLPAGVEALRQAVRKHSLAGIATGRDLPFILELLKREGIVPEKEGWPHVIIAEERYIYYLGKDGGYRPAVDWNESIYQTERSQFRAIVLGVSALLLDELLQIDAASFRVEGEVEEQRGFVEVRFSNANAARAGELLISEWLQQNQPSYYTVRNVAGVAIRHSLVGKGPVLLEACRTLQISPEETLVIGDSSNDLSMLDGGFGFVAAVPENAEVEVKERVSLQGGYLAKSSYGEGVAEAIRHCQPERKNDQFEKNRSVH